MRARTCPRSRSTAPSTATRRPRPSPSGRARRRTILCSRSRGRATPSTAACWRRRAIASSASSIPGRPCSATSWGRCCGSSRRRKSSTRRISPPSWSCCRPSSTGARCATRWKCAIPRSWCRPLRSSCASTASPSTFAEHETYPAIPDVTADFVYARLQKGKDAEKAGYAPKALDAWAKRVRTWAEGGVPSDLDQADPKHKTPAKPRDVFVYFIHEGKVRAPHAAIALMSRLAKRLARAVGRAEDVDSWAAASRCRSPA